MLDNLKLDIFITFDCECCWEKVCRKLHVMMYVIGGFKKILKFFICFLHRLGGI